VEGNEEELLEELKDSIQNIRIKMCGVIKGKTFMKLSEEVERQYESSRERAMREALETAIEVRQKENEDRIRKKCNEIKEQVNKKLIQLLYKASSQSVMVDI
jgi:polyphosphate kinase